MSESELERLRFIEAEYIGYRGGVQSSIGGSPCGGAPFTMTMAQARMWAAENLWRSQGACDTDEAEKLAVWLLS